MTARTASGAGAGRPGSPDAAASRPERARLAGWRRAALVAFALALGAGSALHLSTGLADQGDYARSTGFLLERALSAPPAEAEAAVRLAHWHDRWVERAPWDLGWIASPSSYKLVLAAQVSFDRLVTGDREYSLRVGSLLTRAVLLATAVGLVALALAEAPPVAAALFALLLGAAAVETGFVAFLNSAFEDQVAIVLLPLLALLVWRATLRPSRAAALAAVAVAAFAGASKAQLAALPLLAAPFLWRPLRAAVPRAGAVAVLAAAQLVSSAVLAWNPATRVNVYHAAYQGLLPQLDEAELAAAHLGGAPVLRECVGVGPWFGIGPDCLRRARHSYRDVAALAAAHPDAAARLAVAALRLAAADLDLGYLGKSMPGERTYAGLAAFNVWRGVFRRLGPGVLGLVLLLSAWLALAHGARARLPGVARAALLLATVGATQHAIVLADGLVELPKHVTVGNLALVLALAFGVLAAAAQVESRLKSGSGRRRITAMTSRQNPGT